MANKNTAWAWKNKDESKAKAIAHNKEMIEKYESASKYAAMNSIIYKEDFSYSSETPGIIPRIRLIKTDTIRCIDVARYAIPKKERSVRGLLETDKAKICILNFASFKNPGGMFLNGSMAQEEALCHASNLYNILSDDVIFDNFYAENRKSLNKALYHNRAVYTPGLLVFIPKDHGTHQDSVDVLTCAAPNYSAAHRYQNISQEECNKVMASRIKYILDIMEANKVDIPILGAFGCGVFGNDPKFVAEEFQRCLKSFDYNFSYVSFAVPGGINFKYFEDVLTNGE